MCKVFTAMFHSNARKVAVTVTVTVTAEIDSRRGQGSDTGN